jgi:hypothetical protein
MSALSPLKKWKTKIYNKKFIIKGRKEFRQFSLFDEIIRRTISSQNYFCGYRTEWGNISLSLAFIIARPTLELSAQLVHLSLGRKYSFWKCTFDHFEMVSLLGWRFMVESLATYFGTLKDKDQENWVRLSSASAWQSVELMGGRFMSSGRLINADFQLQRKS